MTHGQRFACRGHGTGGGWSIEYLDLTFGSGGFSTSSHRISSHVGETRPSAVAGEPGCAVPSMSTPKRWLTRKHPDAGITVGRARAVAARLEARLLLKS